MYSLDLFEYEQPDPLFSESKQESCLFVKAKPTRHSPVHLPAGGRSTLLLQVPQFLLWRVQETQAFVVLVSHLRQLQRESECSQLNWQCQLTCCKTIGTITTTNCEPWHSTHFVTFKTTQNIPDFFSCMLKQDHSPQLWAVSAHPVRPTGGSEVLRFQWSFSWCGLPARYSGSWAQWSPPADARSPPTCSPTHRATCESGRWSRLQNIQVTKHYCEERKTWRRHIFIQLQGGAVQKSIIFSS